MCLYPAQVFPTGAGWTKVVGWTLSSPPALLLGIRVEGFEYLKMVVEKITGKPVEQVLQEEVIEPIGLYHTFFSKNDSLQRMVANGHYDKRPSKADLPDKPGMASTMHTEAIIFTRFMLYLLEQKGLSASMYDTILSKHSEDTTYHPKILNLYGHEPGDPRNALRQIILTWRQQWRFQMQVWSI